jgi:hypothetical protein
MTAHHTKEGASQSQSRRLRGNGLLKLGWPQFWLLGGILAGILAPLVAVLIAHVLSN